ncbi:LysR substrate-binding domain-containing protein (plasmid) [Ralstonia sp. 25C]|uniref:LysR substrate-binding domain-containing protein n=1 Tax=Ralstonia sp. 25C TaxID=3447363 RepID=UPI003F74B082
MINTPSFHKIRCFLVVAEELNFRRAAEKLNIAQPAVSRAVKELETELCATLFERTTRSVQLTQAGESFARDARRALDLLSLAAKSAKQTAAGEAGHVSLGYAALTNYSQMADIVLQFKTAFPKAEVEVNSLSSADQASALAKGELDAGLLLSAACNDSFHHAPFCREPLVALVPAHHPYAQNKELRLRELAHQPFVLGTRRRWATYRSVLDSICLRAGFLPNVVEEGDDVPVLIRLVSIGRGITLYGASICQSLPFNVVGIPIVNAKSDIEVSLGWKKTSDFPLLMRFVEHALSVAARHSIPDKAEPRRRSSKQLRTR